MSITGLITGHVNAAPATETEKGIGMQGLVECRRCLVQWDEHVTTVCWNCGRDVRPPRDYDHARPNPLFAL